VPDIIAEGQGAEGVSVATDPVSSFSFSDLHDKAMAYGESTDTPAEGAEQVETPAPVAAAEPDAQNIDNASSTKLAQLKDDDVVEVTVDGEPVQMSWKDAKGGVMRQSHYTKSMQQLRTEQSQFESQRQALAKDSENLQVLRNVLTNQDLLKQFVAKQFPSLLQAQQQLQEAAAQADPNDLATVGQIQEAQRSLLQQQQDAQQNFLNQLAEREEQLTRTIEDRQATAKLSTDINTTIKSLFSEAKHVAQLIPNAEQVLRYEVLQLQPKTPEETLEAFKTVFGGWVENYNATVKATTKQSVIEKHKLSTNNIQPPGGAPPQPEPTSFKKVNKMTGKVEVDWDKLRSASLDMLDRK
jgi:hypothetical protein